MPFTGRGRADDHGTRVDAPRPRSSAAAGYPAVGHAKKNGARKAGRGSSANALTPWPEAAVVKATSAGSNDQREEIIVACGCIVLEDHGEEVEIELPQGMETAADTHPVADAVVRAAALGFVLGD